MVFTEDAKTVGIVLSRIVRRACCNTSYIFNLFLYGPQMLQPPPKSSKMAQKIHHLWFVIKQCPLYLRAQCFLLLVVFTSWCCDSCSRFAWCRAGWHFREMKENRNTKITEIATNRGKYETSQRPMKCALITSKNRKFYTLAIHFAVFFTGCAYTLS